MCAIGLAGSELRAACPHSSVDIHTEQSSSFADIYTTDEFRMYAFKILPCSKRTAHDWQACVFAHFGEKARRRCLRTHGYRSELCPDSKREGGCPRGDNCPFSHNIFEAWLHPELYRTQLCTAGANCNRTVCFFAHSPEQLRQPNTAQQQQQHSVGSSAEAAAFKQQHHNALLRANVAAAAAAVATKAHLPPLSMPSLQQQQQLISSSSAAFTEPTNIQLVQPQHLHLFNCSSSSIPDHTQVADLDQIRNLGLISPASNSCSGNGTVMLLRSGTTSEQQLLPLAASSCSMACNSPTASVDSSSSAGSSGGCFTLDRGLILPAVNCRLPSPLSAALGPCSPIDNIMTNPSGISNPPLGITNALQQLYVPEPTYTAAAAVAQSHGLSGNACLLQPDVAQQLQLLLQQQQQLQEEQQRQALLQQLQQLQLGQLVYQQQQPLTLLS